MRSKLLENVINQLEKDIVKSEMDSKYVQFGRMKTTEQEPMVDPTDYEEDVDDTNIMPSIRDNEYLQHSSLWGAQYMSGWVKYFLNKKKKIALIRQPNLEPNPPNPNPHAGNHV